jgi:hypothetical protein
VVDIYNSGKGERKRQSREQRKDKEQREEKKALALDERLLYDVRRLTMCVGWNALACRKRVV